MKYEQLSEEQKNKFLFEASDNQYVADLDLDKKKLIYSKDFYIAMYKLIEDGFTYVQAYEKLGFDTKKLGVDRANSAGKRAKKMCSAKDYTKQSTNYNGSIPREDMGELSAEEELAYYKARNAYLESVIEVQKKTPQILEELYSSLKKN